MHSTILQRGALQAARSLLQRGERQKVQLIQLQTGQTWAIPAQCGARLLCTHGTLWVTQIGEPSDFILRETNDFTARRDGLLVVQAVGDDACLHFCSPPRGANRIFAFFSSRRGQSL